MVVRRRSEDSLQGFFDGLGRHNTAMGQLQLSPELRVLFLQGTNLLPLPKAVVAVLFYLCLGHFGQVWVTFR
jgi:hypothetical protein